MTNEFDPPAPKPEIQTPGRQSAETKGRIISQTLTREITFAGPLPPPGLLAKYNEVVPNGAERIFAMAERQSAHRESMEAQVVTGNLARQREGAWFAFILALLVIGGGIFLLYNGRNVAGLVAILSPLAVLAGVFVYAKRDQRKERDEKATALETRRSAPNPPDKADS